MNDYPSNSNAKKNATEQQPTRPERKSVVVANKTKKTGLLDKITESDLGDYIINDVIKPTGRRLFDDLLNIGAEAIKDQLAKNIFGESARGCRSYNSSRRGYHDYRGHYNSTRSTSRDRLSERQSSDRRRDTWSVMDYDKVVYERQVDAEDVLDQLDRIIEQDGIATVADLYQLSGIRDFDYTCYDYGWTSMRNTRSQRARGGGYTLRIGRTSRV